MFDKGRLQLESHIEGRRKLIHGNCIHVHCNSGRVNCDHCTVGPI